MGITQNLVRRLFSSGFFLLAFTTGAAAAFDSASTKMLAQGSNWTVNIDGFDFKIQLYGKDQQVGTSGSLRRGIGGKHGKGLLDLKWRGRQATLQMNVPVSNGKQAKCTGIPARNLTFISGTCDSGAPFVMTPTGKPGSNDTQLKSFQRSNQLLKSNISKASSKLKRCQGALSQAYQERDGTTSPANLDARDIAQDATRKIPRRSGDSCAKCDSVTELNVPQNPRGNTLESRWLTHLLNAQNAAIADLFGATGRNQVAAQERNVCQGKQKCFALFRQNVITAAAQQMGGS
jgi:hypothetical protein